MKIALLWLLALAAVSTASADFSYTMTRKAAQAPAPGAAPQATRQYLKGQKLKIENGDAATILDFDAQTVTAINNTRKTYSVTRFGDLGQALGKTGMEAQMDVKDTGQHKTINGFDATEVVMTVAIEAQQAGSSGMKMTMVMDTWSSPAVPGAQELRAFYEKNAGHFPWAALGGGGSPSAQKAMAEMQRKMAESGGVPLLQVIKMTSGTEAQIAQAQAGMARARARLEQMKQQGGQQAVVAEQLMARMAETAGSGGSGSFFEITMESSDFSTSAIPDSVFAIPAGYQMTEKK